MPKAGFLTGQIHERLEKEDILSAFLRATTDIERLFFEKLKWEKKLDEKLVKNWTLGRYIKWVTTLNLVDKKWYSFLNEFNEVRNKIAHERGYVWKVDADKEIKEYVKNLVLSACKFLEETRYEVELDYSRQFKNQMQSYRM